MSVYWCQTAAIAASLAGATDSCLKSLILIITSFLLTYSYLQL